MNRVYEGLLIFILFFSVSCGLERWEIEMPSVEEDATEEVSSELSETSSASADDAESGAGADSSSGDSSSEDSSSGDLGSTGTYPSVPSPENDSSGESGVESEVVNDFDWSRVLITEVVTDPQQDHGESTEANGIPFDAFIGTGTVGSSDEYVEIFNGTAETVDMSLWSLGMMDGTDEFQDLNDEDLVTFFSLDGKLEEVGAGEFLVLGNPSGAMNNSITLELLNESGEIVDSVNVDDANASDVNDEAYYRSPTGEWMQGWASPGYFLE